jgi:hypothetical protein
MGWAWHVEHMGKKRSTYKYLIGNIWRKEDSKKT